MVGSGLKDFDPAVGSQCIPKPDSPLQVGINALALRLPSWLGHVLYVAPAGLLVRRMRHPLAAVCTFVLLLANPFLLDVNPYNLPEPATPFVGRRRELAAVAAQLADPTVRLVTIHGLGGMGKEPSCYRCVQSLAPGP